MEKVVYSSQDWNIVPWHYQVRRSNDVKRRHSAVPSKTSSVFRMGQWTGFDFWIRSRWCTEIMCIQFFSPLYYNGKWLYRDGGTATFLSNNSVTSQSTNLFRLSGSVVGAGGQWDFQLLIERYVELAFSHFSNSAMTKQKVLYFGVISKAYFACKAQDTLIFHHASVFDR